MPNMKISWDQSYPEFRKYECAVYLRKGHLHYKEPLIGHLVHYKVPLSGKFHGYVENQL